MAKAVKLCKGSAPGSTNISGVEKVESLNDNSRSNSGGFTNYSPISYITYSLIAGISLSGLSTFRAHNF